jgi:MtN3 and saliva related transmembrane protein
MFLVMAIGVGTWTIYGMLQQDFVVIGANAISFLLLSGILYFKVRETFTDKFGDYTSPRCCQNKP